MAGISGISGIDEETLYYQYLINNNSTSTMLNAISGSSSDDDSSSLAGLSSLISTGSSSDFSTILQNYLSGINTGANATDSIEAAQMMEKLSSVLEEASQTEDTSSLSYQTVQELYQYFADQVAGTASALTDTVQSTSAQGSASTGTSDTSTQSSSIDGMNQAAMQGEEFDFSSIDSLVEDVFKETMPMS